MSGKYISSQQESIYMKERNSGETLADILESDLLPLLRKERVLLGLTLWEYFDDNYPEEYAYGLLRTLQRCVANYKLEHGPSKDVIFRQLFPAGIQGMSDFTYPDTKITITGVKFKYIIYQFVLTHSHHKYAQIIQ